MALGGFYSGITNELGLRTPPKTYSLRAETADGGWPTFAVDGGPLDDDEGEVGAATVVAHPCAHVLLLYPDPHLEHRSRTLGFRV